ncbi:unnamed protein product [Cuscuta epithymum]|uniref:F-box domain-containing protein n=2 Tax=Cuscuta epithymum TaxID=186058 RepID=A0AAV0CJL3_9ASTE|nr:unnamed protein product [Cuscuta epithymum]
MMMMMNHQPALPPEIIAEILQWLPVKSVLKFRCVSKLWLSLISSDHFIQSRPKKPRVLTKLMTRSTLQIMDCCLESALCSRTFCETAIPFPVEVDCDRISIVDSCNGLLCLATDHHVILWNPATRESKMVPHVAAAEVEPKSYDHEIGFGFGESCGDYKVVKLIEGRGDASKRIIVASVYSLKTDTWKSIEDIEGRLMSRKGKFVDGKLYWAMIYNCGRRKWKQCSGKAVAGVLCVDVKTETYEEIEPLLPHSDAPSLRVAVLDGRLCLVSNSSDSKVISFWVLMKNKQQQRQHQSESWSKMFKIFVRRGDMKPLYKLSKSELLLHSSDSLFVYNAKDKSCRYTGLSNCSSAHVYVESLVSPTKYPTAAT